MKLYTTTFLIVILLLSTSPSSKAETYWNGSTYSVEIPGGGPTNFLTKARYTMFIPKGISKIQGVLIHQHGCGAEGWGAPMATDAQYQAFATKWGFAILGTDLYPKSGSNCFDWINPEGGSGDALLAGLDSLAAQSGHPELNYSPWLLWGHSGGGYWVLAMTKAFPERIIATFSYSPGLLPTSDYPAASAKIPVMIRHAGAGDFNAPGIDCWGTSLQEFSKLRSIGGLASIAYNAGQNHNYSYVRYMAIPFFESVLSQRLPGDGSSQLRDMDPTQAWLADTITSGVPKVYKASTFTGNPKSMSWLPDSNCAAKFREYLISGIVADITAPFAPTKFELNTKGGIKNAFLKWEAEADIESGIRNFNIYVNNELLATYPYGYFQLFDTNGDTPYPVEQPLLKYSISGLTFSQIKSMSVSTVNWYGLESPRCKFDLNAASVSDFVQFTDYSKELIACEGTKDGYLQVSTDAIEGFELKYQWLKDGHELFGDTLSMLKFPILDYSASGVYRCRVNIDGVDNSIFTPDIPVYALIKPAITDQPKDILNAQIGGKYSFEVQAHIDGKAEFQWYKYAAATDDTTALENNTNFSGTKSPILIISDLSTAELCKKGDYYFVELISQCGTVRSAQAIITQKPDIIIVQQPSNSSFCQYSGSFSAKLTFHAYASDFSAISYRWQKDGIDLKNNELYSRINEPDMYIKKAISSVEGSYRCIVQIVTDTISKVSNSAYVKIIYTPEAKAKGDSVFSVKKGQDIDFNVIKIKGSPKYTIIWSFEGMALKSGIITEDSATANLHLEALKIDQSGWYSCTLINECGQCEVRFYLTVIDDIYVEDIIGSGYSLSSPVPNPANGAATIRYNIPDPGFVRFTLSDIRGRELCNLFEGNAPAGINTLEINTQQLALPAGVYFYTMRSGTSVITKRMVVAE